MQLPFIQNLITHSAWRHSVELLDHRHAVERKAHNTVAKRVFVLLSSLSLYFLLTHNTAEGEVAGIFHNVSTLERACLRVVASR